MKKRICDHLKMAVILTAFAGILGTCAISAAEFEEAGLSASAVSLKQSAEWTDEENFQAELTLEVNGLKELYRKEQENAVPENGQMQDVLEEEGAGAAEDIEHEVANTEECDDTQERTEEYNTEEYVIENAQVQQDIQNTSEIAKEAARYFLTAYISEYFQVNEEGLKHDMQAESVQIQNQKGETVQITKLTCEVVCTDEETDTFNLKVPVFLREEYRISPVKMDYPVCQDAPLCKDQDSTGAYFWMKTGEEVQTAAVSPSPLLSVKEADAGLTAQLQREMKEVRAGQELIYILSVQNTGMLSLENIEISSVFSISDAEASWKEEDGFSAKGTQGMIACLKAGEIRKFQITLQLTEEQAGELFHTVTVKAKHPGREEYIGCQTSDKTVITALKAAFEVEKTADRTQAYPGDTITYQICIRNTGERTLHSVLSTERFQNAGIQAKFVQKEGVTLNSTGTQALIPQIVPGEAFALYATVIVPQYLESQELVNEVTVISDETGTQTMRSQANVELTGTYNTVTVTPQPTPVTAQGYGYGAKSGSAFATASKPRTGDRTETTLYIVLGILGIMSGVSVFCYMKIKKHQK